MSLMSFVCRLCTRLTLGNEMKTVAAVSTSDRKELTKSLRTVVALIVQLRLQ